MPTGVAAGNFYGGAGGPGQPAGSFTPSRPAGVPSDWIFSGGQWVPPAVPTATDDPSAPNYQGGAAAAGPASQSVPYATATPGFNGNGATPQYGTQSPTMFGTGQYVAPLFPINDQAITGAPAQGAAQNYGLNDVWTNLQNELSAARTQGGGMITPAQAQAAQFQAAQGTAALAGPTQLGTAGNTVAQQQNLANILGTQAAGGGTSAADIQLQGARDANIAASLALLGSQRGQTNAALASRSAVDQAAAANANAAYSQSLLRAQETSQAQQALGSVLSAQGSQAAGYNETQAQLEQQTALANQGATNAMTAGNLSALNAANLGNAQLSQQTALANLGATNTALQQNQNQQYQNAGLYQNEINAILGAQTGIGESNRSASLADQQLELQQLIAANQVNEQGYAAAAQGNANLTGAAINGIASLASAGINAAGKAGSSGGGASSTGSTGGATMAGSDLGSGPSYSLGGSLSSPASGYKPPSWAADQEPALSDENLKTGIEGGNPMMRSFLQSYRNTTASTPTINVNEGARFSNPTYAHKAGQQGDMLGDSTKGAMSGASMGSSAGPIGAGVGALIGFGLGAYQGTQDTPGSSVQTGAGSGVTVDESGWGQIQSAVPTMSDDREKEAVMSGNRGMQAFLQQASAQTGVQNGASAGNNAFMQTGRPPSNEADRQLPPWMGGSGGNSFGGTTPYLGGTNPYGGGVASVGGYNPATLASQGGITPMQPMGATPFQSDAEPLTAASQAPLAANAAKYMPTFGAGSSAPASQQPPFASPVNPGAARYIPSISDENEKQVTSGDVQGMLDQLHAYQYRYKDPSLPGAAPGKHVGVMAQDLEKSPLGSQFVVPDEAGRLHVDYGQMAGTQLAASAMLNDRLNEHDKMIASLMRRKGAA